MGIIYSPANVPSCTKSVGYPYTKVQIYYYYFPCSYISKINVILFSENDSGLQKPCYINRSYEMDLESRPSEELESNDLSKDKAHIEVVVSHSQLEIQLGAFSPLHMNSTWKEHETLTLFAPVAGVHSPSSRFWPFSRSYFKMKWRLN